MSKSVKLQKPPHPIDWVTVGLCAYEISAILSPLPTISELTTKYKWLGPVLITTLSGHFLKYSEEVKHGKTPWESSK